MDPTRLFGGISSLARVVDPRSPSNRFALLAAGLGAVLGAVATLLLTDLSVGAALLRGVAYGIGAFLAWAIARELDPDDPIAARNTVFAYAVAAWAGVPALAATLALLLTARVVVRTTGRAPTRWDLAAIVVVAGFAATSSAGLVVALALAYAVFADTRLADPAAEQEHTLAAVATALVAVVVNLLSGVFWSTWRGPGWLEAVVLLAAIAAGAMLRTDAVTSRADVTGEPLHLERVQHARWLLLGTLLAAVVWTGAAGIGALAPAFSAVIGVGATAAIRARPTTSSAGGASTT